MGIFQKSSFKIGGSESTLFPFFDFGPLKELVHRPPRFIIKGALYNFWKHIVVPKKGFCFIVVRIKLNHVIHRIYFTRVTHY